MKYWLLALLLFCCLGLQAQSKRVYADGDRFAFLGLDLYRSDVDMALAKAQFGLEAGYQFHPRYAFTGGLDFWTTRSEPILLLGGRFFPTDKPIYLSHHGLLKERSDLALGIGYSFPFSQKWLANGQLTYLLNEGTLSLRMAMGVNWSD